MTIEIKVPVFPESVTDGTLVAWKKKTGELLERDEIIAEIETDKVVFEVPAIDKAVMGKILVEVGTLVVSGQVIGTLESISEEVSESKLVEVQEVQALASGDGLSRQAVKPVLGPAAEKAAVENKLDVSVLTGSGKNGRILKEDIMAEVKKNKQPLRSDAKIVSEVASAQSSASAAVQTRETKPASIVVDEKSDQTAEESTLLRHEKRVPMTRLRARIAERLLESQQTAAILTTFNEINMQAVMEIRTKYRESFEKTHEVKLGFMSFFVKATVEALKRFPDVNASIDGKEIVYHGYQDLGIAVGSPRGLVVPILRDCDDMDFADVERGIVDFGTRAREGSLTLEEMTGGTFSITNGGVFGSLLSTPIINPPQSAILGLHKIEKRAMVEQDEVVVRPMMYVALSYDHRLIDGRGAVQFLVSIKEQIEDPARLLLGV
ncbi:Dihydrolipoamide succinyltransferase component (E2) of 2-oxoglutarate dehydrogenase complex [hydrothermal vent metagenome]|uniref:dihydrolipoyllysine-residue succinyltransferase n=1 Tax=hydrothermal vent metagenome TaxID=652676 RepID=A0A3B0YYM7_9ZZZZ